VCVCVCIRTGDATCALEDSVIEWSSNVGVLAHVGKSEATVSNCTLRHNFIASGVDDASTLSLCMSSRICAPTPCWQHTLAQ
jgi:hypothetical protein